MARATEPLAHACPDPAERLWEFVSGLRWADVPVPVRRHLAWLTADVAAVSVAARDLPSVSIAADYASAVHAGTESTSLLDGRRLAAPGAAFANAALANSLDLDDGHRITKGHPGAMVVPAALAVAEARNCSCEELLLAILIGYEVAIRAGVELHTRERSYHASGAWGSLGVAAACGRLMGLDRARLAHAINITEYHAPIASMTRAVTDPAMTKDAVGWGAFLGVSSALLAEAGYTGLSSEGLPHIDVASLGTDWAVESIYVKRYPCCRWSQPAIDAALALRPQFDPEQVADIEVRAFAAATTLSDRRPQTSEEMQYSLTWPLAVALDLGRFGAAEAISTDVSERTVRLAGLVRVAGDEQLDREFPARRLSRVIVTLRDGSRFDSGVTETDGEPGDAEWEPIVAAHVREHLGIQNPAVSQLRPPVGNLGERELGQLIDVLTWGLHI